MDDFITLLYCLVKHCGYGELQNEMIRDHIVVGLQDAGLSEKLQLEPELILESALQNLTIRANQEAATDSQRG